MIPPAGIGMTAARIKHLRVAAENRITSFSIVRVVERNPIHSNTNRSERKARCLIGKLWLQRYSKMIVLLLDRIGIMLIRINSRFMIWNTVTFNLQKSTVDPYLDVAVESGLDLCRSQRLQNIF